MSEPSDRCPLHHCPTIQVCNDRPPRCLVEWLQERCGGQQVKDFIPPNNSARFGELIFSSGLVLPILRMKTPSPLWKDPNNIPLAALTSLRYSAVRYLPNDDELYMLFRIADTEIFILAEVDLPGALNELLGEESDLASAAFDQGEGNSG